MSCLNAVEIFIFTLDYGQCAEQLNKELYRISSQNKVLFIFAAMKCNYSNDWNAIYVAMLNFAARVYKGRVLKGY